MLHARKVLWHFILRHRCIYLTAQDLWYLWSLRQTSLQLHLLDKFFRSLVVHTKVNLNLLFDPWKTWNIFRLYQIFLLSSPWLLEDLQFHHPNQVPSRLHFTVIYSFESFFICTQWDIVLFDRKIIFILNSQSLTTRTAS
jgi:hypothetical protein